MAMTHYGYNLYGKISFMLLVTFNTISLCSKGCYYSILQKLDQRYKISSYTSNLVCLICDSLPFEEVVQRCLYINVVCLIFCILFVSVVVSSIYCAVFMKIRKLCTFFTVQYL